MFVCNLVFVIPLHAALTKEKRKVKKKKTKNRLGPFAPPLPSEPPRCPTPPWPPPRRTRTPLPPPAQPSVPPWCRLVALLAARACLAASTWGMGTSTPSPHCGPPSSPRRLSPARSGASAISAFRHGVLAPMALLGLAPLHEAPVFHRLVLLHTPAASRGGPRALRLDVAPPRAVAASDIWSDLLVALDLIPAALQPQSLLANSTEGILVCER